MIPNILDYTIEKVLQNQAAIEQKLLKKLTGKSFANNEAKKIWTKVQDHKWYLSERLGRDVGMHVATIDYLENIHPLPSNLRNRKLMTYSSPNAILPA